jgi:hypothetical protein
MQARVIRNLFILCFSMAVYHTSNAQDASRIYVEPDGWSIGMNFGMTDMWCDVGTKSPIDHYTNSKYFDKVAFMGGMFGRYTVHPSFGIRFMLNYGTLYATDQWNYDGVKGNGLAQGTDYVQRYLRSQNAKTDVLESSVIFELTPRRLNPETNKAHKRGQPFIGAGVALFHYTPYSTVGGGKTYVKTYDLDLEGQGWTGGTYPKKNSQWQPAIPLVIGYRWDLGQHLNLGIEYMWRMTFFDYLDGVSGKYVSQFEYNSHLSPADAKLAMQIADKQSAYNNSVSSTSGTLRGNPGNNDSYSTITITFFYKVKERNREWWH